MEKWLAKLFDTHRLAHNKREIKKIEISKRAMVLLPWSISTLFGSVRRAARIDGAGASARSIHESATTGR